MREIKYKAWDKSFEQIVEWENLKFDKDVGDKHICFYEQEDGSDSVWNGGADYILMQYTGLKDKNGKEIYEGDIIQFNNCDYQRTAGHLDDEIVVGKVEYSCGRWGLIESNGQSHDLYIALVNDEEAEVIGNIYEDKHLLES